MTEISVAELARRICVAGHPLYGSTVGARIPCGSHIAEAQRSFGLTLHHGDATLRTIIEARIESGIGIPTPDGFFSPRSPLDIEALRGAIYEVSQRHNWATEVDTEDRTQEIADAYWERRRRAVPA